MTERATLLGPGGEPISAPLASLPASGGHHGGQAGKREEAGEFFTYGGGRVAREDLIESPSRHMLPGPAGVLSAVRIRGDLWLVCELGGEILAWAKTKEAAIALADQVHRNVSERQAWEQERAQGRAERLYEAREKRWKNPGPWTGI